jgi:hypothetical protein
MEVVASPLFSHYTSQAHSTAPLPVSVPRGTLAWASLFFLCVVCSGRSDDNHAKRELLNPGGGSAVRSPGGDDGAPVTLDLSSFLTGGWRLGGGGDVLPCACVRAAVRGWPWGQGPMVMAWCWGRLLTALRCAACVGLRMAGKPTKKAAPAPAPEVKPSSTPKCVAVQRALVFRSGVRACACVCVCGGGGVSAHGCMWEAVHCMPTGRAACVVLWGCGLLALQWCVASRHGHRRPALPETKVRPVFAAHSNARRGLRCTSCKRPGCMRATCTPALCGVVLGRRVCVPLARVCRGRFDDDKPAGGAGRSSKPETPKDDEDEDAGPTTSARDRLARRQQRRRGGDRGRSFLEDD